MTQGSQGSGSLQLTGSKVTTTNSPLDLNGTNALQHMKQELCRLQAENGALVNQLNCFISLVQRSWQGDSNATIHLSNIIGLEPPHPDTTSARLQTNSNTQSKVKTKYLLRWEQLSRRLLEKDKREAEDELREYQHRYLENRQAFMDAVLQDHHQTMGIIPLSRQNSAGNVLEQVDSRFIKHNMALQRMGGQHSTRVKSAKFRPPTAKRQEVKAMDISLRELVGDIPSSSHFVDSESLGEKRTISAFSKRRPQSSIVRLPPNSYNNPARYSKMDVFEVKDTDGICKPRPVSASTLRDADTFRSRPRSGSVGRRDKGHLLNQRPLKYETTKPQAKQSKLKAKQLAECKPSKDINAPSHTDTAIANECSQIDEGEGCFNAEETELHLDTKPPMFVKVKRPAHIDSFDEQERALHNLEEDFRKTAVSLQKKLGLEGRGIIALD